MCHVSACAWKPASAQILAIDSRQISGRHLCRLGQRLLRIKYREVPTVAQEYSLKHSGGQQAVLAGPDESSLDPRRHKKDNLPKPGIADFDILWWCQELEPFQAPSRMYLYSSVARYPGR
jgi:hypothetical protein